jgi:hypothetical protein
MSTHQSIPHLAPRVRIGLGTVGTALGVLVAIAVAITILALTGANHTTVATPVTASQAAAASTPQVRYLGPRQEQAARAASTSPAAGIGNPAPHYTCLGAAQRCLR